MTPHRMLKIVAIVEGHGETKAVPVLLRRISARVAPTELLNVQTVRVTRNKIVKANVLERIIETATRTSGRDAKILVLLDADDDCPKEVAPALLRRAHAARRDRDIRVVLANSEFEAWFLASIESLAGRYGVGANATRPSDPEAIRNAKGWLSKVMPPNRPYKPTRDQAPLAKAFDLDAARTAPSFDKFWRDVCSLLKPEQDIPPLRGRSRNS